MNNELLVLIEKHAHTFVQQTKTKPKRTLEFKMGKMETFFV